MGCIEEIRQREVKATKGPWAQDKYHPFIINEGTDVCCGVPFIATTQVTNRQNWKSDAHFIAHARTDIPYLLAELDKRDRVIDLYHDALKDIEAMGTIECTAIVERARKALKDAEVME